MKPILSVLLITLFSTSLLSDETKNETQKIEEKQTMTDEEFLKKFMALDKEVAEEENKLQEMKKETAEMKKLRKTAEELAKTLGVNK